MGYFSQMKVAKLSDVKNGLSHYVEHVRGGGRVRILHRGVPVADLVPVSERAEEGLGVNWNTEELERRGLVRRGRGGLPPELAKPGPRCRGKSIVDTLLEERHSGR